MWIIPANVLGHWLLAFVREQIIIYDSHNSVPDRATMVERKFKGLKALPGCAHVVPNVVFAACRQQPSAAVAAHCHCSQYLYLHMEELLEMIITHLGHTVAS
jgi:hypothetical protein